jgi:uncharacterized protein (DUF427 family)
MGSRLDPARKTESVWDYPRPPRLEPTTSRLRIVHRGILLADTTNALRILETSHPPVYYIPPADIAMDAMRLSPRRSSYCEFKGSATYWTIDLRKQLGTDDGSAIQPDGAWSYPKPTPAYTALRDHLAFYASRVDECSVDGEIVVPQEGDFYGGWITSWVTGPFKGPAGTLGW